MLSCIAPSLCTPHLYLYILFFFFFFPQLSIFSSQHSTKNGNPTSTNPSETGPPKSLYQILLSQLRSGSVSPNHKSQPRKNTIPLDDNHPPVTGTANSTKVKGLRKCRCRRGRRKKRIYDSEFRIRLVWYCRYAIS